MSKRGSLFLFLMRLAWRCRFSMPLLLSGSVALLGHAWMLQIRVRTVHRATQQQLAYYEDSEDESEASASSSDSWETIVEEVAYG